MSICRFLSRVFKQILGELLHLSGCREGSEDFGWSSLTWTECLNWRETRNAEEVDQVKDLQLLEMTRSDSDLIIAWQNILVIDGNCVDHSCSLDSCVSSQGGPHDFSRRHLHPEDCTEQILCLQRNHMPATKPLQKEQTTSIYHLHNLLQSPKALVWGFEIWSLKSDSQPLQIFGENQTILRMSPQLVHPRPGLFSSGAGRRGQGHHFKEGGQRKGPRLEGCRGWMSEA